ncbi:hypothetical protein O181_052012 [Austropuccinia psidii MF-1]|uniref:Uncharacterized protein n=1 Tax=Austropuccinia psidii MF-1 TaxID=1389203 RepID=A0A9Q3E6S8_9BASI|nr:hypothetical protein [Austropuccinia psidii MF-1]
MSPPVQGVPESSAALSGWRGFRQIPGVVPESTHSSPRAPIGFITPSSFDFFDFCDPSAHHITTISISIVSSGSGYLNRSQHSLGLCMALGSSQQPVLAASLPSAAMRRADSTRSNTSSRSVRATTGDSKQQEDLINALEAEEERLVNTLTRKLEKLRAEKAELENVLEAESESLVLKLQRQLSLLMQQQQQSNQSGTATSGPPNPPTAPTSPSGTMAPNLNALINNPNPLNPSPSTLIEALKTENSNLRTRLVDTEREYIKTCRQNEVYRSELITLRQRLAMPIDDLIGAIPSGEDNHSLSLAARRRSGTSTNSNGIPIPGLSGAEIRRRSHHVPSFSSSSIQLGSSLTPSTPMTPNSLTGESANLISASLGTSLTTPSTSYPGLPVPHSTPATSPADGRHTERGIHSGQPAL